MSEKLVFKIDKPSNPAHIQANKWPRKEDKAHFARLMKEYHVHHEKEKLEMRKRSTL